MSSSSIALYTSSSVCPNQNLDALLMGLLLQFLYCSHDMKFHSLVLLVLLVYNVYSLSHNNDLGVKSAEVLDSVFTKLPNLKNFVW